MQERVTYWANQRTAVIQEAGKIIIRLSIVQCVMT